MTAKLKSLPAIEVAQRLRTGHAVLIDVREADEFARRAERWQRPAPKVVRGILAKYVRFVRPASEGCVTDEG